MVKLFIPVEIGEEDRLAINYSCFQKGQATDQEVVDTLKRLIDLYLDDSYREYALSLEREEVDRCLS